jgi:hypothetical protein
LIAFAAAVVGVVVYLLAAVPPTGDTFYPRCQFHATTGLHCPGCGTTRALHALLNGKPLEALQQNALFPVVLPVVAWAFVYSIQVSHRRVTPTPGWFSTWGLRLLIVLLVVYTVARNLPYYPFTLLAPHEL